jgi:hypothetical protein
LKNQIDQVQFDLKRCFFTPNPAYNQQSSCQSNQKLPEPTETTNLIKVNALKPPQTQPFPSTNIQHQSIIDEPKSIQILISHRP